METRSDPVTEPVVTGADGRAVARTLGRLLRQTSEYEAFWQALQAANQDPVLQRLGEQIRAQQAARLWGDEGEHEAALARLEQEVEMLSVVRDYHQAESRVNALFSAVDALISQAAGLDFAANARRSGCSCGG